MARAHGVDVVGFQHGHGGVHIIRINSAALFGVPFVAVYTVELDGLAVDINLVVGNMNLTDAHTVRNSLAGRVQHKGI